MDGAVIGDEPAPIAEREVAFVERVAPALVASPAPIRVLIRGRHVEAVAPPTLAPPTLAPPTLAPPTPTLTLDDDDAISPRARPRGDHLRRYGIALDVGAPDGATAALVIRATPHLQLDTGVSFNGISEGVRAGATWAPLSRWATPTASIAVGAFADGDANPLARLVTGDPSYRSPVLARVGYRYGEAQLGVELGRKRCSFYVRAGATRMTGSVHGLAQVISDPMSPVITFAHDPNLTLTALSARLGMVVYFGGDG